VAVGVNTMRHAVAISKGRRETKMTKVTYICRSAKKKSSYFIFIDFFLRRFLGVS
jgi:hypothetical protein